MFVVTVGRGKKVPYGEPVELDPSDPVWSLALLLSQHSGEEAWWSGGIFTEGHRTNDGWISQQIIGADVDYYNEMGKHALLPTDACEQLVGLLSTAPCTIAHLTPRGARLIVLLDEPITDPIAHPQAWAVISTRVKTWIPKLSTGSLRLDTKCKDQARYFWSPRATIDGVERDNPLLLGAASVVALASILADVETVTHVRKTRRLDGAGPEGTIDLVDTLARARMWLEKADPAISGKDGHGTAFRIIERVVRGFGLNDDEALTALYVWNQRCEPPWSEAELRHKIKDGRERGDTPPGSLRDEKPKQRDPPHNANGSSHNHGTNGTSSPPPIVTFLDPRPVIRISTELHHNVDQSVQALRTDPHLYQRNGKLVHVTRVTKEQSEKSPTVQTDAGPRHALVEGSPQIVETSIATLRERLTRYARYEKYNERLQDYKKTLPTDPIVAATHARGEWPLRQLVGIVETPTLRPDGSVVQEAGYDYQTGYLYRPSENFSKVDERPSYEDAKKALRELIEVFTDFPYVKEKEGAHRSVPVAAILTLVARPAIQGATPAFVFDASTRGSGKTLQTDAIAMVVSGRAMPRMNFPTKEEELEKVLGAYAMRGAQFFSLDNVTRSFGGGALDRVITARDTVDLRVLGRTEIPTLPWRAVVLATGNNIHIYADTARRVLLARLEPGQAEPEKRTDFVHDDLPAWLKTERARLVVAALTILRGYFVAGRPHQGCDRWGSFEEWSRLIPQAIVWAGGADPMGARANSDSDVDPEVATVDIILKQIYALMGKESFRASQVVEKLAATSELKVLREAVIDFCDVKPGHLIDARSLGKRLSRYRGRIVGGYRLNGAPGQARWVEWSVTPV